VLQRTASSQLAVRSSYFSQTEIINGKARKETGKHQPHSSKVAG
jgi:hypothetical protein